MGAVDVRYVNIGMGWLATMQTAEELERVSQTYRERLAWVDRRPP